ncbi:MAG: 16S rRNA (cytosine(1402)-N(4))-methyltransferase RsmH [Verrucomicrobia bacterium]|nr:16S rRNA (cytosine(1402)-N(4))-methyltransferase RsmH [Verrucomicrobiota bacterium]
MSEGIPHRRRPRYSGKNPRRFEEKYKELSPEKYPETVEKVLASGKTPAGSHVPIMVAEILEILHPRPGEAAVDCTLGHGGHSSAILPRLLPGGLLLGLDVDPLELPKTEARLRAMGFGPDVLMVRRSNFAGLPQAMAAEGLGGADCILADLGVSSMQLDTPGRGFSTKVPGPLDMRMNPARGISAAQLLKTLVPASLAAILRENADEPHAGMIAPAIAGKEYFLTTDLADAIRACLRSVGGDETEKSVRRVFQALRIEVNEEFSALDNLLRVLPGSLNPGGRVAVLTFHSGEDRRVKKAFQAAHREGIYTGISDNVTRPSPGECRANPRATSAKLRWAVR